MFIPPKYLRKVLIVVAAIAIVVGGFFGFRAWHGSSPIPEIDKLNMAQAAKMGTKTTHELLIQIEDSKCDPQTANRCYQRGDVVMTVEGEKQWSPAEEEGFLIIKMDLTPTEAQLLTRPLKEFSGQQNTDPSGQHLADQKQLRRFAVDLAKIGIAPNDQQGRLIGDKIFTADILVEKK